jgi:ABC-type uncharacterized transport system ATPase subunit
VGEETARPPVLACTGITVRGDRGQPAVRDLTLEVRTGEIVGIAGVEGNGQAELVEAIAGLRPLAGGTVRLAGRVPLGGSQLDKRQVRAAVRRVLEEYLNSRDVAEVRRRLDELAVPADLQHQTVRAAIELGIERRDPERELVSRLLSSLHEEGPAYLSAAEAARGFEQLLERLDDLAIDNPRAPELLAAFLTRAVADEVLVLAFVGAAAPGVSETQLACLSAARAPLAASHFGERRRHVWGAATDGTLEALKRAIAALCDEYFVSGELAEAVRYKESSTLPHRVHRLNARWNAPKDGPTEDERFETASALCGAEFGEMLRYIVECELPAREIVETAPPETFFSQPRTDRCKLFLSQILSH